MQNPEFSPIDPSIELKEKQRQDELFYLKSLMEVVKKKDRDAILDHIQRAKDTITFCRYLIQSDLALLYDILHPKDPPQTNLRIHAGTREAKKMAFEFTERSIQRAIEMLEEGGQGLQNLSLVNKIYQELQRRKVPDIENLKIYAALREVNKWATNNRITDEQRIIDEVIDQLLPEPSTTYGSRSGNATLRTDALYEGWQKDPLDRKNNNY